MRMQNFALAGAAAAVLALAAGCAHPDRSRNLADPKVSATTLAQQVCSNCHGMTGNSVSPNFPNLAGQQPAYFIAQLNGFRSHSRQDPAGFEYMWGLSRSLTDAQTEGLAAYYAAQKALAQPVEGERGRIDAGKAIFETGIAANSVPACMGCHGAQGQGMATFPRLAGQHADYTEAQLVAFRGGVRKNSAQMMGVAAKMNDREIKAVADYIAGLR